MNEKIMDNWQDIGDWKDGRVRSGAKTLVWISLLFGITFTGISLPGVLAVPEEIANGNYAILLVLLFPLVGLGALALFIHSILAWRKFGRTEVVLDPVPGSIGGDFGGSLEIGIRWKRDLKMDVTLDCQHLRTTGSGKNRSTKTSVVWQRQGIATITPTQAGIRCEFRFDIPEGVPQSEATSRDYHRWLLQLECDLPGIDFKRSFVVPIFHTPVAQRSSLKVGYAKDSAPLQQAPDNIVRINDSSEGLVFYYPWYRHWWMGFMTTVVGTIFVLAGYFVGKESGDILFPIAFGGIGGVCAMIGLYVLGNTLTTTVTNQGIRIVRNVFGIRFQRKATREDIIRLDRRIGSQMQTGASMRVYYAIDAHTRDNRRITIADTLEGSRLTDFVEAKIRRALWPEINKNKNELEFEL